MPRFLLYELVGGGQAGNGLAGDGLVEGGMAGDGVVGNEQVVCGFWVVVVEVKCRE